MSGTIGDVLVALGERAPWDRAAGWDPVGLQVGDAGRPAGRVAVCHEVTEQVVELVDDVDLLISYHPLVFRPLARIVAGATPGGRALRLIERRVAVAAVHTNFDAAPGGTADALAAALGLEDLAAFGPVGAEDAVKVVGFVPGGVVDDVIEAMAAAGAGTVGNYTACSFRSGGTGTFHAGGGATPAMGTAGGYNQEAEVRLEMVAPRARESAVVAALVGAHPYEEPAFDVYDVRSNQVLIGRIGTPATSGRVADLAARVESALGGVVRVAGRGLVGRVAVVPGSGAAFIDAARSAGADVLVTGDVGHHAARAAGDAGLAIIDPGHVPTERPGVQALYAAVADIVPDAVEVTAPDTDLWERS